MRSFAALNGFGAIIDILIAYGADVNAKNSANYTALTFAGFGKHQHCIDLLTGNVKPTTVAEKKTQPPPPKKESMVTCDVAEASFDFTARSERELTIKVGQEVAVIEKRHWRMVEVWISIIEARNFIIADNMFQRHEFTNQTRWMVSRVIHSHCQLRTS